MSILPEGKYVYHMHYWCLWRSSEEVTGPLELKLQMVGCHRVSDRVKSEISARAASALNQVISSVPIAIIIIIIFLVG